MTPIKTLVAVMGGAFAIALAGPAGASTKAEYDAAKDRASADYKMSVEQCKSLAGNPKDVCEAQAKATKTKTEAMAEADYKATPKAHADALETAADADYDVAKQKCDALKGNDNDVCIKQAKATQTRAKADAKAGEKTTVARRDAASDVRDADYKVAMEKCDAYAGDAKSTCQKNAKSAYGK